MLIGSSSRLPYDECAYPDKLQVSTGPLLYKLSTDQIYNCDSCLSTFGPRSSIRGNDVSKTMKTGYAPSQDLVDLESILTNRNVLESKCKTGRTNPVNVTEMPLQHVPSCGKFLDPVVSRLTHPAANYRDASVNRFYNLPKDPQANIFWNFSVNTRLEAKDNFIPDVPQLWADPTQPTEKCFGCQPPQQQATIPVRWGPGQMCSYTPSNTPMGKTPMGTIKH